MGYQVAIVNHKNGVSTVEQGVFIQQHDDSKLTEKDFTGFFSNDGGFYELIASDHLVFPYFGGWNFLQLMTWSFDGQRHSVNVDTFIDISCTFSGGNGCLPDFRIGRKLLGRTNSDYWMLEADATPSAVADGTRELQVFRHRLMHYVKNPLSELNRFDRWISDCTLFELTADGSRTWSFSVGGLRIGKTLPVSPFGFGSDSSANTDFKVVLINGRLYITQPDSTVHVLELLQAGDTGLQVCEYAEGTSCDRSKAFWLSNRRPAAK